MRIAIANDLKLAVEVLTRIIQSQPQFSIAWIAYDGKKAVELAASDPPDLLLMDLIMPIKNGYEATSEIMQKTPCPILIVSSQLGPHMNMVFETMGAGALDVVATPTFHEGSINGSEELLNKIESIASFSKKIRPAILKPRASKATLPPLVVFGASTGGPSALVEVIDQLEQPLKIAVIIVQHVDKEFLPGFCRWLGERTGNEIKIAEEGETPQKGVIYVANTHQNIKMNEYRQFEYTKEYDNVYVPSVDLFFSSVAHYWPTPGFGILLTGMGSDGAKGLHALKQKEWYTLVQDESSCVVFGMPKKAIESDAVSKVASLNEISKLINQKWGS